MTAETTAPIAPKRSKVFRRQRGTGSIKMQDYAVRSFATIILAAGAVFILVPLIFMISTSLKDRNQMRQTPPMLLPLERVFFQIDGKDRPVYDVTADGVTKPMVLLKNMPQGQGLFADVTNLEQQVTAKVAEQKEKWQFEVHWENYPEAVTSIPFLRYTLNTLIVTFVGMAGMLFSCSLVAYGFSRFRARWLNILFLVLLSTIMLPAQVRLIPTYVLFQKIGWIDTLLPLIVPLFFANAYDVFLLRQFFMTIPLELDDAARVDGASPLQILLHIILPQSRPILVTLAVFHFLYAWNDFYEPLIYLHTRDSWTLAVGIQSFNALYSNNTHLIMAASALMIIPPIVLFFLAQKIFVQGVVFSGVKG